MFPGSGIEMGYLGGESSSSGCTGPFCTQSTSKYLQQCILLRFLGVVLRWDLLEVEAQVVDAHAHSVHNLQVRVYSTVCSHVYW
jgi:hypothetical protein